ncbi:hypothetical protein BC830DRAFT_1096781 [Chytriomyces sp. MP71]|nr:hypothetical protein BC830DRAFT_1096781 [Chytriomyces sp. MP71]
MDLRSLLLEGKRPLPPQNPASSALPSSGIKSERRVQQIRSAQKKYRDKKQVHVKKLDERVKVLERRLFGDEDAEEASLLMERRDLLFAENKELRSISLSHTGTCSTCATEQLRVSQLNMNLTTLRERVSVLKASTSVSPPLSQPPFPQITFPTRPAQLDRESSPPASALSSATSSLEPLHPEDFITRIVDVHGPMDLEFAIPALHEIDSLSDNPHVELTINAFRDACHSTDKRVLNRLVLKMLAARHACFDACNVVDRAKAVEIFHSISCRNQKQMDHMYRFIHEKGAAPPTPDLTALRKLLGGNNSASRVKIDTFLQSIRALPSLASPEARTKIDDLAATMSALAGESENSSLLYRMIEEINGLASMCVAEDEVKFLVQLEVARAMNRVQVSGALDSAAVAEEIRQ